MREEYLFPPDGYYDDEIDIDEACWEHYLGKNSIVPFIYDNSRRRNINKVQQCGICSNTHTTISSHLNPLPCKCGANVLSCQPHTMDDCRIHTAAVKAHLQRRLSPPELILFFNEGSVTPGRYYCDKCGIDTTESWNTFKSHHVFDKDTRTFVPICLFFSFCKPVVNRYNNNSLDDSIVGIDNNSNVVQSKQSLNKIPLELENNRNKPYYTTSKTPYLRSSHTDQQISSTQPDTMIMMKTLMVKRKCS